MLATQTPSNNLTFCPFSVNEITLWVKWTLELSQPGGRAIDDPIQL